MSSLQGVGRPAQRCNSRPSTLGALVCPAWRSGRMWCGGTSGETIDRQGAETSRQFVSELLESKSMGWTYATGRVRGPSDLIGAALPHQILLEPRQPFFIRFSRPTSSATSQRRKCCYSKKFMLISFSTDLTLQLPGNRVPSRSRRPPLPFSC